MDEAMLFKFGKWVEYGRVHAMCPTVRHKTYTTENNKEKIA